jgi:hypothetical protein
MMAILNLIRREITSMNEQQLQELKQRHKRYVHKILDQSNEQIMGLYKQQMQRLKTILQLKQQGKKRPLDVHYPNTLVMNLCRRELERRGLSIPRVSLQGGTRMDKQ